MKKSPLAIDATGIDIIDDQEYKLDESILVIAYVKKAVAIAGIMGGKQAEVTNKTKNTSRDRMVI